MPFGKIIVTSFALSFLKNYAVLGYEKKIGMRLKPPFSLLMIASKVKYTPQSLLIAHTPLYSLCFNNKSPNLLITSKPPL